MHNNLYNSSQTLSTILENTTAHYIQVQTRAVQNAPNRMFYTLVPRGGGGGGFQKFGTNPPPPPPRKCVWYWANAIFRS
jgi:hypothetical protein